MLLIGMGTSGQSLKKVFEKINISHFCFDDTPGVGDISFEKALNLIQSFKKDLLVAVSPGIRPSHPLIQQARENGCSISTEIDIAFELYQKPLPPFLGVTGTNGKTTVVEFISFALLNNGIRAETVGNIGLPLVERLFLQNEPLPDVFVIELSSFQLEYTKRCPLKGAVYLNFAPDHLEWHETLAAYHHSKERIFSHVEAGGVCLVHTSVPPIEKPLRTFSVMPDTDVGTDGEFVFYEGIKIGQLPSTLRGKLLHDTENFLASCGLLVRSFLPYDAIKAAWEVFQKGPHRIQLVETINTVSFYDDSKATNISSTEAAVKSLLGPIVLIAGGVHKGFSYSSWKAVFKNRVQAIVAIGQAQEAIFHDLNPDYTVIFAHTLEEALFKAASLVPLNGNVLLSPGCSSFDMFKNYKERGDLFQKLIRMHRESIVIGGVLNEPC